MRLCLIASVLLFPSLAYAQQGQAEELLEAYLSMALGGAADLDVQMRLDETPAASHAGLLPDGHTVIGAYDVLVPPSPDVTAASTFARFAEEPEAVVEAYRALGLPEGWTLAEEASPFAGYFELCGPGLQGRAVVSHRFGGGSLVRVWTQPDPCPAPAPAAAPADVPDDDARPDPIALPDLSGPAFYLEWTSPFADSDDAGPAGAYARYFVRDESSPTEAEARAAQAFAADGWDRLGHVTGDQATSSTWSRTDGSGALVVATATVRGNEWGETVLLVTATR